MSSLLPSSSSTSKALFFIPYTTCIRLPPSVFLAVGVIIRASFGDVQAVYKRRCRANGFEDHEPGSTALSDSQGIRSSSRSLKWPRPPPPPRRRDHTYGTLMSTYLRT